MDCDFNVDDFLHSLRGTKPPWECPICHKSYKSYVGIENHVLNFDHSAPLGGQSPGPTPSRKFKLKSSKKKKNNKLIRRSPSPVDFTTQARETLTWAEAQRMVEVESEGKTYRLNISDKLDIISDSDVDKEDDSMDGENGHKRTEKSPSPVVNSRDLKDVTLVCTSQDSQNGFLLNSVSGNSEKSLPKPTFRVLSQYESETNDAPERESAYYRYIETPHEDLAEEVEYDMDEEDTVWLELMNKHRKMDGTALVTPDQLETLMDRFEKESYFEQARNGNSVSGNQLIDEDAVCCVCNDGECQNSNVILFCDMCNLAVHQECYGVPYIPEGQWLCRRCLQSPSCPVSCRLCPNRNGAFKQTDDGHWAHVVCALWVPEVGFANTVFLEPIDGLKRIPAARWRLSCYICKQRHAGASIQCHRANCYTAFHVTCAQQAGLYMKMEPVRKAGRNGMTVTVEKEAYCDVHTPSDASPRQYKANGLLTLKIICYPHSGRNINIHFFRTVVLTLELLGWKNSMLEEPGSTEKMKTARRILAEKRHEMPQVAIPYIPRDNCYIPLKHLLTYRPHHNPPPLLSTRVNHISRNLNIQKKGLFLQRLLSYWTLKRQSRNGVPLLRRLHSHVQSHKQQEAVSISRGASQQSELIGQLKWNRLRHDLERARLLIELIRKREKLKREQIRIAQAAMELKLLPLVVLLRRTLQRLRSLDTAEVFLKPVTSKEAPNYFKIISTPMDFSKMGSRVESHHYKSVDEFEADFNLIIKNCMVYNTKDTVYYKLAVKMRDHGGAVIRAMRKDVERMGLDWESGMLSHHAPTVHDNRAFLQRHPSSPPVISEEERSKLPLDEQKKILLERLDTAILNRHKTRKIRNEITLIRRKRLWSARSPLPNNLEEKKSKLARSTSCPTVDGNNVDEKPTNHTEKMDEQNLNAGSVNSANNSDSESNSKQCVNRRTAVLFKKKHRKGNTANLSTGNTAQGPNNIERIEKNEVLKTNQEVKEENPLVNGNSIDNGKQEMNGRESFRMYRGESAARTTSDSSDANSVAHQPRKKSKSPKKIRSHSLDDNMYNNQSDLGSETSNEEPSSGGRSWVIGGEEGGSVSTTEDDTDDNDLPTIEPLDLVWAKCRGYPPYPALLIDPMIPQSGYCHNGVPIPVPPHDVLQVGNKRVESEKHRLYLVLFFDTKRTWQWLPRNKLEQLGVDKMADQCKLAEGRRPALRKNVESAYKRAVLHRSRVTGQIPDSD
uniref:Peregrin n=1 Tax=Ciona savignyi TaxID=51511 RepID=H2Y6F8_CIOSA